MESKEKKVDFDMSILSLSELINLYEDINDFLQFLDEKKIIEEENKENQNE